MMHNYSLLQPFTAPSWKVVLTYIARRMGNFLAFRYFSCWFSNQNCHSEQRKADRYEKKVFPVNWQILENLLFLATEEFLKLFHGKGKQFSIWKIFSSKKRCETNFISETDWIEVYWKVLHFSNLSKNFFD